MRKIMALADKTNQYIDEQKPWVLIKDENQAEKVQQVCTVGVNAFRSLCIYLKPVMPELSQSSRRIPEYTRPAMGRFAATFIKSQDQQIPNADHTYRDRVY